MNDLHQKILELMEGRSGSVLDAGAGTGDLSHALQSAGFNVFSCDIAPDDFKHGKCRKVDLNGRMPYKNNTFDYVVYAEVLEHVENPHHLLREANRVLKMGGTLIISTPNIANVFSRIKFLLTGKFFCFSDKERKLGHLNPVAWWELEEALRKHGFRTEAMVSNSHLRLSGCDNMSSAARRFTARLAFLILYPFIGPKNMEILRADSLIFMARKVKVV